MAIVIDRMRPLQRCRFKSSKKRNGRMSGLVEEGSTRSSFRIYFVIDSRPRTWIGILFVLCRRIV
jgi:hypothetical protein